MSKVAPRSRPRSPPAVAGDPHGERFADLAAIAMPTLVVNGDLDVLLNTINSFCLQQHLPDAQLIIYPDSGRAAFPVSRPCADIPQRLRLRVTGRKY